MTLQDDYAAIRAGAALVTPSDRARIAVAGRDRASYLQGLLTNDIAALRPGTGCYAAWLTPQGRMTTDAHVFESGDMILLDVPAAMREPVLQRLDQFIFSEDVQVSDLTGALSEIGMHGPNAAAVLERTLTAAPGVAEWAQYANARAAFGAAPVVIARVDRFGVPGYTLFVEPGLASELAAALEEGGATRVGSAAVEAARVEAGYPLYGIDMDEETIPLEAGIEPRAISMSKGCYVGQEVIVRVLHRGHGRVVRRLIGLRLREPAAAGARIHAAGRDIGALTSAAVSPRLGPIALGYVHRDFTAPGTQVAVDAGVETQPAEISALPFA
jgi:folate-binding protein YgfZ